MATAIIAHTLESHYELSNLYLILRKRRNSQRNVGRLPSERPTHVESVLKTIVSSFLAANGCFRNDAHEIALACETNKLCDLLRPQYPRILYKECSGSGRNRNMCADLPRKTGSIFYGHGEGDSNRFTAGWTMASTAGSDTTSSSRKRSTLGMRKRGKDSTDDGNAGSDDDDASDRRKRHKQPSSELSQARDRRFACPFFKHNPWKHLHGSCATGWFRDTSRLKQHLYRVHTIPIQCMRCYQGFRSDEALRAHLISVRCEVKDDPHMEGISQAQIQDLKRRIGLSGQSEEDKWRYIYQLLFPETSVGQTPSPYIEDSISEQLGTLITRELPKALEDALTEEFEKCLEESLKPALSTLKHAIPRIIEKVTRKLRSTQDLPIALNEATDQTTIIPCNDGKKESQTLSDCTKFPELHYGMPFSYPEQYSFNPNLPLSGESTSAALTSYFIPDFANHSPVTESLFMGLDGTVTQQVCRFDDPLNQQVCRFGGDSNLSSFTMYERGELESNIPFLGLNCDACEKCSNK